MPELIVEREGPVATLRISNPAKYNAMTLSMWQCRPCSLQRSLICTDGTRG